MLGGWKLVVGCYLLPVVVVGRFWLIHSGVGWWSFVGYCWLTVVKGRSFTSFRLGCNCLVIVGWSKVGWLLVFGGCCWSLVVVDW